MQLLMWIADGLILGWLTGKTMASKGRDLVMDSAMGATGAVAGGFFVAVAPVLVQGKMIYTNLAAIVGAVTLTVLFRYLRVGWEYGSTLQRIYYMKPARAKGIASTSSTVMAEARHGNRVN
jgi:uncharacterized membrane protein YeaQ/YmgE (transglycosylase-associated protein family)